MIRVVVFNRTVTAGRQPYNRRLEDKSGHSHKKILRDYQTLRFCTLSAKSPCHRIDPLFFFGSFFFLERVLLGYTLSGEAILSGSTDQDRQIVTALQRATPRIQPPTSKKSDERFNRQFTTDSARHGINVHRGS